MAVGVAASLLLLQPRTLPELILGAGTAAVAKENLVQDNLGDWWIRKGRVKLEHRRKASSISNIPLLPVPLAILEKYMGIKKFSLNMVNEDSKIETSTLKDCAGLIGACLMARSKMLQEQY